MKVLHGIHPEDFKQYDTQKIREHFLLDDIVQDDALNLVYTHYDRMIVGGVRPIEQKVMLGNFENLKAEFFLERREMGIINVGGEGIINLEKGEHRLQKLDCLYIGQGEKQVSFSSVNASEPAVFYILSTPAHRAYPTTLLKNNEAESGEMGSLETSNQRTIYRYIHKNGIQSCQLVMGLTILKQGSVWNTMPAHTHDRRMEAYFYFDVPENNVVFHFMGQPHETRHIVIKNWQAAVSPPWSIHSGSGTSNYGFIWGMGGENKEYSDMDGVAITDLR